MRKLIDFILKELWATLSEYPSFLSSKKVERCLIVTSLLTTCILYIMVHIKTMVATDLMAIVIPWLGYGGYGMMKTQQDKLINQQINGTQTNNTDTRNQSVIQ